VNPDVDAYTKTRNHRKTLRKTQKKQFTENQKNSKYQNTSSVRARFLHLTCQGRFAPLPLFSYTTYQVHFKHKQSQVISPDSHVTIGTIQQAQVAASVLCS